MASLVFPDPPGPVTNCTIPRSDPYTHARSLRSSAARPTNPTLGVLAEAALSGCYRDRPDQHPNLRAQAAAA